MTRKPRSRCDKLRVHDLNLANVLPARRKRHRDIDEKVAPSAARRPRQKTIFQTHDAKIIVCCYCYQNDGASLHAVASTFDHTSNDVAAEEDEADIRLE